MNRIKRKTITHNGVKTNYYVTDDGKVYSKNYMNTGKTKRLKTRLDKDGYEVLTIYLNGKRIDCKMHILVARAFIPNPENKPQVNHKDGVKTNNCVDNLEWNTGVENVRHALRIGLKSNILACEKNPAAIHSNEVINYVCELIMSNKYTLKEISDITGVSKEIIKQILHGKLWTRISSKYDFSKFDKYECRKLSYSDVVNICELLSKGGMTMREISDKLKIDYGVIWRIYKRKYYNMISKLYDFSNVKLVNTPQKINS